MKGFIDYHRTIVGYHGTSRDQAEKIVRTQRFQPSKNQHDWLGHGVYYWEHAPRQALWWAQRKFGRDAAVVASMIRLGQCLDLLDPANAEELGRFSASVDRGYRREGKSLPHNTESFKYRDAAVFALYYEHLAKRFGQTVQSVRAMFLRPSPTDGSPLGQPLWDGTWLCHFAHVQICIRPDALASCILGTWPVIPAAVGE